jgi:hypothetical protein
MNMSTQDIIAMQLAGKLNAAATARTRYRNQARNWIALGVLLTAWQMEAQLDRDEEAQTDPRLTAEKPAQAGWEDPLWATGPRARSWISRAAAKAVRTR